MLKIKIQKYLPQVFFFEVSQRAYVVLTFGKKSNFFWHIQ